MNVTKCEHGFPTAGSDRGCSAACPIAVTKGYSDESLAKDIWELRLAAVELTIATVNGDATEDEKHRYNLAKIHIENVLRVFDDQMKMANDRR